MAKRARNKAYVVWVGRRPGVYHSWAECELQVKGFDGARFKGFPDAAEAARALEEGPAAYWGVGERPRRPAAPRAPDERPTKGLCVDAACNGAGGDVEYRGVLLPGAAQVFHAGPFPRGTNNIGEFLALVHGLAYLRQRGETLPVYSDSRVAIGWVTRKQSRSGWIADGSAGAELQALVRRAETWLQGHDHGIEIRKWETADWGEIPADFGRK